MTEKNEVARPESTEQLLEDFKAGKLSVSDDGQQLLTSDGAVVATLVTDAQGKEVFKDVNQKLEEITFCCRWEQRGVDIVCVQWCH